MLTQVAEDFLDLLLSKWTSGSGPDANQLITLWGTRAPSELRPVLDELKTRGHLVFNTGLPSGPDPQRSSYGLKDLVGVTLR